MGLGDLLEYKGVQSVLVQIIKQAAPDLIPTIEGFSTLLKTFDERMKCVQEQQTEILKLLREQNHGREQAGNGIERGSSTVDNGGTEFKN